jgi:hypothetical protein
MTYLGNASIPLTPEEELILAEIMALGTPGQVLAVDPSGTGLYYVNQSGGPGGGGDILTASVYNVSAVGGILLSSQYSTV